jgi:4-hydroxy-2-oxoheptanedioate aldolase
MLPAALKKAALDFVFLDTEHVPLVRDTLGWMCQAYKAMNMCPIVRIPEPDPYLACMALDGGASGIIAPYVETVEQVRQLRGATKLRPLKGRRLREILESDAPPPDDVRRFMSHYNASNVMILNIESAAALERLDELVSVPDVDGVLVGPHDLSINLGVPEQYDHPKFMDAVSQIIRVSRARNVGAGVHFPHGTEKETQWAKEGANMILHGMDRDLFVASIADAVSRIREAMGDEAVVEDGDAPAI